LALKLSETTFPSVVKTNFEAAVVPAFGAVFPVFSAFRLFAAAISAAINFLIFASIALASLCF
jgi:hypothetical protein